MTEATQTLQLRAGVPKAAARISGAGLKQVALGVVAGIGATADYGRYYWTTGS